MENKIDFRILTTKEGERVLNKYFEDNMKELQKCNLHSVTENYAYMGWNDINLFLKEGTNKFNALMLGLTNLEEKGISYQGISANTKFQTCIKYEFKNKKEILPKIEYLRRSNDEKGRGRVPCYEKRGRNCSC